MENIIILLNIISEILSFGSVLLIIILYFLSIKNAFTEETLANLSYLY